jgi:hypothetical protein
MARTSLTWPKQDFWDYDMKGGPAMTLSKIAKECKEKNWKYTGLAQIWNWQQWHKQGSVLHVKACAN